MLVKKLSVIGFILLLFLATPITVLAGSTEVDEVARELICQCGCYAVLNNCTHGECMVRDGMTSSIELQLSQGQSKEQIIKTFVSQYGEAVLASPPKKGFNLTAWITPFAVIIVGGIVIWFAIKRWVHRGKQVAPKPSAALTPANAQNDAKYLSEVERDLKELSERGFR
jgi:cytochrome c-type biogenesis protein CcmH